MLIRVIRVCTLNRSNIAPVFYQEINSGSGAQD